MLKSFFVHELPPNCTISHLRERIAEVEIPFSDWEMAFQNPRSAHKKSFKILNSKKSFQDYDIQCWDCIYVRPRSESCAPVSAGSTLYLANICRGIAHKLASLGKFIVYKKARNSKGNYSKRELDNGVLPVRPIFLASSSSLASVSNAGRQLQSSKQVEETHCISV
ncbi:hypothetical protein GGF37_002257 [Kickxella alabastrina]|nr:hypothetical protein GGF37_002257 [Kickxella alabastrina]